MTPHTHTYSRTGSSGSTSTTGSGTSGLFDSPTSTTSTDAPLLWGPPSNTSSGSGSSGIGNANMSAFSATKRDHVNANSYCGRHSSEFLFGGKGLGDLWKAVTKK